MKLCDLEYLFRDQIAAGAKLEFFYKLDNAGMITIERYTGELLDLLPFLDTLDILEPTKTTPPLPSFGVWKLEKENKCERT